MADASNRVTPLNTTARQTTGSHGNPVLALPDDATANCYPGLEVDVRNFDRRFFPGLVFEFIARNDVSSPYREPTRYGARLTSVEVDDEPDLVVADTEERRAYFAACNTDLATARALRKALEGEAGEKLSEGDWYLDWIEQGQNRLAMNRVTEPPPTNDTPLDGLFVWRFLRSLAQGPVVIGLQRRDQPDTVELEGWRRRFLDPVTGVINAAYQPGELLQSLCSPWQHDFRDCYCNYWAANRPDIVFIEPARDASSEGATDSAPQVPVDWLRADRAPARAAGALETHRQNRPYQFDHYQINATWQDLAIVVNNTELTRPLAFEEELAPPFKDLEELGQVLRDKLAPLELTLAFEYLFARFSLKSADEARDEKVETLADDVTFARDLLLMVATSEMQHLRLANELLWHLHDGGHITGTYRPVLTLVKQVPGRDGERDRLLRRFEPAVIDDFIFIERPSTTLTGQYARVIATLKQAFERAPEPEKPELGRLLDLALRVANEGGDHERSFLDLARVFRDYDDTIYLRPLEIASPNQFPARLTPTLKEIADHLRGAYAGRADATSMGRHIGGARRAMVELLAISEEMAGQGLGTPFFELWESAIS